ncbi:MAG: aldehyde dehydrogenase family protein, partial [Firmicutes bacterium]|nr:aldehyde dehydrogenase family protein [Bacillota bacterium]
VIPTTNPTSTAIFKALLALKTRNAIIFSPHPRAKESTIAAARVMRDAAVQAGAPRNVICWINEPSLDLTNLVMREADLILATGGPGMVRAAYSSGKPAVGVGPGNVPAVIDETADIKMAVSSIVHSKSFDNGVICASEQSVTVLDSIYEEVRQEFAARGCYFLQGEELDKLRRLILIDGEVNPQLAGQSAVKIAAMAG